MMTRHNTNSDSRLQKLADLFNQSMLELQLSTNILTEFLQRAEKPFLLKLRRCAEAVHPKRLFPATCSTDYFVQGDKNQGKKERGPELLRIQSLRA